MRSAARASEPQSRTDVNAAEGQGGVDFERPRHTSATVEFRGREEAPEPTANYRARRSRTTTSTRVTS
jgi:hypothetical protein